MNPVTLLDGMDESATRSLRANLGGISETEMDWRPIEAANSVRWILSHLIWFEEWARDALDQRGRYLTDTGASACPPAPFDDLWARFENARREYRARIALLTGEDLAREIDFFGRERVTVLDLLTTHTQHLSGHRFQIRYIRGAYSRTAGTEKALFDPW
ncbi:MAG: hypothetical protein A3H96_08255 [Acidobacteria bacterium RIFCSPLOWO2_02_FULL_67_36]|nr:MAG: hypothetical protein A3H96_08255 [Acidobacteria bacterium RIFCSPLOWO2_02_FULL_67_36]OFW24678.1 MAG: hypothetical protein A3G21_17180 [Acidobacteria bacterium RIFCSPLOWO2_12_FULL_66_21]